MAIVALRHPPLPTAIEAEQAVLGAILIENRCLHSVAGFLRADHFGEGVHAEIFKAAAALIDAGEHASPLTIAPKLPAGIRIGDFTAAAYLARLCSEAVTISAVASVGRAVFDAWARRELSGIAGDLVSTDDGARDLVSFAESRLLDLTTELERADPAASRPDESYTAVLAEAEERKRTGRHLKGAPSGLRAIDDKLGGFSPGELILLAGRPSMGKTALGLSMCRRMARVGVGVAFDSIEMREGSVRLRLVTDECEAGGVAVPYSRLAKGQVDDREMAAARSATERLQRLPLPILDRGNRLSDIPGHVRTARRELEKAGRDLHVLMIDYLGLVAPGERYRGSKVNEVGEISSTLKALARRERIAIIALHQLSRANEARDDKRPRLSDLRDSGNLEQDADVAMFVHREHYYLSRTHGQKDADHAEREVAEMNHMEVLIEKNRQGPTGVANLWCNMATNAVRDLQI